MVAVTRPQRAYDHRLREFVHRSGSDQHAVGIGIPRSTLHSWKSRTPKPVVGLTGSDKAIGELESEVVRLTLQVRKLRCILRLLLLLLKVSGFRLESLRLPERKSKQRLLREVDRACPNTICFWSYSYSVKRYSYSYSILSTVAMHRLSPHADGRRVRVPLVCYGILAKYEYEHEIQFN